ncbi:MAG: two pore domain potassium channel family protein [Clostridiales bacterium]|nr:two pore domain potassium channel family protein [Clostridiales bacterium]
MNRLIIFVKKYRLEALYLCVLLMMIISNQSSDRLALVIKGVLIIGLWIMPYFLNLGFKIINTVILAISTNFVSATFFMNSKNSVGSLSVIIALMLFTAMVVNIFLVIKEMYQLRVTKGEKRNGFKLLYVVLAFMLLIGTVVFSYSHIYENILTNNPSAFSYNNETSFSGIYFSSTTYFTVGYGDIIPVSALARGVSISQMVFGYIITCLILPTTLVAFQKLFEGKFTSSK